MRNNPVFQVLVTSGNQAVLAVNKTLEDLAIGQIGVFDRSTNLSINAASKASEIYIAMGVDTDLDGVKDDIMLSAGQFIQGENFLDIEAKCYQAGQTKQIEVHNMTSVPATEYGMKFQFLNGNMLNVNGYQTPVKTYMVLSSCSEKTACNPCNGTATCSVLPKLFYDEITNDKDGLLTVEIITPVGVVIPRDEYDAWVADPANVDLCPGLRITAVKEAVHKFCNININYDYLRETDINLSLIAGFNCTSVTQNVVKPVIYEQGSGYDIKQSEYFAGGWNGNPGPYRTSSIFGLALGDFNFNADITKKYTQISLLYNLNSVSGWRTYDNNLETTIAVPCTDTTTLTDLSTLLDGWIAVNAKKGIKPIAAVITTCGC